MTIDDRARRRYLVCHDCGMGGIWWWIAARSAREIVGTFAEVEVVDDPEWIASFNDSDLDEVDIDDSQMPRGLDNLRAKRDAQRGQSGFGVLIDRGVVYLRQRWDGEQAVPVADYLTEIGPDGRRTRQVEVRDDGGAVRTGPDDWALNPPIDLWAPELAECVIGEDEFERSWATAESAPTDW